MSPQELLPIVRRFFPEDVFPEVQIAEEPGKGRDGGTRLVVSLTLADLPEGETEGAGEPGQPAVERDANTRVQDAMRRWRDARDALAVELTTLIGAATVVFGMRCGGSNWLMFGSPSPPTLAVTARLPVPALRVLDTLVAAGIVPSRAAAVQWCIQRIADRESELLEHAESLARQRAELKGQYGL